MMNNCKPYYPYWLSFIISYCEQYDHDKGIKSFSVWCKKCSVEQPDFLVIVCDQFSCENQHFGFAQF